MQTLPQHRNAELRQQLKLLDCTIERHYPFSEDLALARIRKDWGALGVQAAIEATIAGGGRSGK
jgi:hypothetical protein